MEKYPQGIPVMGVLLKEDDACVMIWL